jgi:hypothetical protein
VTLSFTSDPPGGYESVAAMEVISSYLDILHRGGSGCRRPSVTCSVLRVLGYCSPVRQRA